MLDRKDKKLLVELLKDGRLSLSKLGRKCRMSRQGVFGRLKSLRRRGIIRRFTVELDPGKLGLNLRAYVLISAQPSRESREKTIERLKLFPEIAQIHQLFGRFDFIAEVLVENINQLSRIIGKIHELEMIDRTETLIVHQVIKYDPIHCLENVLKR